MALAFGRVLVALIAGAAGGVLVTALRSDAGKARPAARRAVRTGVQLYEQARQTLGELGETASDLIAEAQAELEQERESAASPQAENARQAQCEHVVPFEGRTAAEAERKLHG